MAESIDPSGAHEIFDPPVLVVTPGLIDLYILGDEHFTPLGIDADREKIRWHFPPCLL